MNLGHLVNKQEQASWWGREHRLIDAKIKAWASLITGPTAPGEGAIGPGGRDVPPWRRRSDTQGTKSAAGVESTSGSRHIAHHSPSVLLLEVPGQEPLLCRDVICRVTAKAPRRMDWS